MTSPARNIIKATAVALAVVMALATCGGSDSSDEPAAPAASDDTAAAADTAPGLDDTAAALEESAEEAAGDLADTLESAQAAAGGGSMTLTVGDETWTFEPVLCAIGEEQTGQEGAEFVLSSIQDGKQMYVSIDRFGHSVSLNDVEDFENPSVSLSSFGGDEFIVLDGKSFTGQAEFIDTTTDSLDATLGTFSGTCP